MYNIPAAMSIAATSIVMMMRTCFFKDLFSSLRFDARLHLPVKPSVIFDCAVKIF
jgi:hypothetical protein